jgi:hypothetical protein
LTQDSTPRRTTKSVDTRKYSQFQVPSGVDLRILRPTSTITSSHAQPQPTCSYLPLASPWILGLYISPAVISCPRVTKVRSNTIAAIDFRDVMDKVGVRRCATEPVARVAHRFERLPRPWRGLGPRQHQSLNPGWYLTVGHFQDAVGRSTSASNSSYFTVNPACS